MTADTLSLTVLIAAGVLIAGMVAVRFSYRTGMPGLLLFLLIGVAIGEAGMGLQFDDADLTRTVGTLFLAVILVEGGLTTRWSNLRPVLVPASVLASVGILATVAVTTGLVLLLLRVDLRTALILGSVAASTDAAATFAILRRLPIRERTRALLEAESGFNDPPVIVLVAVITSDAWFAPSVLGMVSIGLYQLILGAVTGLAIAWAGQFLLRRVALPASGLYPLAILAIAMVAFSLAGVLGASGLLASYVTGLWLGNAPLPHLRTTRGFVEALGWLSQIGLFVMLGLLSSPGRLPDALPTALVVGAALTFVARPVAVLLCVTPFRIGLREQMFLSWAGLRGAVPIVLATIPMTVGLPGAERVFDVVFLLVVMFTLIQGPLLPLVARWSRIIVQGTGQELDFESAPLEESGATVLKFEIPPTSRLAGLYLDELRLPRRVSVAMVLRDREVLVPDADLRLTEHDSLVVALPDRELAATEQRLQALSRGGRLVEWSDGLPD